MSNSNRKVTTPTTLTARCNSPTTKATPTLEYARECLEGSHSGAYKKYADDFRETMQTNGRYCCDITKDKGHAFYIDNCRLMLTILLKELNGNDVVVLCEVARALRDNPITEEVLETGAYHHAYINALCNWHKGVIRRPEVAKKRSKPATKRKAARR